MTKTSTGSDHRYRPIGDYALLSDCHSSALVNSEGSIDWACLRRFDAGSTFARILDFDRGGFFAISPMGTSVGRSRRYVGDTMVLETTLHVDGGTITITDAFAMRPDGSHHPLNALIRRVEATEGTVMVDVRIEPRFDYGSARPWLRSHTARVQSAVAGDDSIVVHSDIDLRVDGDAGAISGRHRLRRGDSFTVMLIAQPAHQFDAALSAEPDVLLAETLDWWGKWSAASIAEGPYAAMLTRSALVLKSLTCGPTGAIIAAPTTSLPEVIGGTANWDYRYCWIRDATLTLAALSSVGHDEVSQGFREFLMRSAAGHGEELQIMYGAYGERRLPEFEVDLCGWNQSSPVRVGNEAAGQTQLDVYGHVLTAVHLWHCRHADINPDEWAFLASLVELACRRWTEADAGIWEIRGDEQQYVHSKVMLWAAIDCGIELATDYGLDGADTARWIATRDAIREAVDTDGVDPLTGSFVQHFGSVEVDASLLQLAITGFVEPDDPRLIATVAKIESDLCTDDGFVRRYRSSGAEETVDGDSEGVFLLCTCWLVQVMVMQGRTAEARELFERLLELGNDVGLYAEEFDPNTRQLLGNFPQAFTHLGLIASALAIESAS
ncbi:MAG: glycoside hydrolase family 15 protein [Ilumatobacteraceae bacterium]